MYRFGDGTPFPIQENFIETLLAAVDATVGTFAAAADVEEKRDKALAARKDADEDLRRLGMLDKAIEAAVMPLQPASDRTASPSQMAAAKALAASRTAIGGVRAQIDAKLAQLAGEPRTARAAERTRTAMSVFFEHHQLPDTAWRWSWKCDAGARATGEAMSFAGKFRAMFDLDLEGAWNHVVRIGALVAGLVAVVPRKKTFGGVKRGKVHLDKCGLISVERAPERQVIVIREHAHKASAGWRVLIKDPERADTTVVAIDAHGKTIGDELALEPDEALPFLRLWDAIDAQMLELRDHHRTLRDLKIGDASLESITDPAQCGRALLAHLGPLCKQVRTRSRVPDELSLKRDIGDGRREELYVSRETIERKFAMLPPSYRRPFEDIGLGRHTTEEVGLDDMQTRPEPPPMRVLPPPPPAPLRALPNAITRLAPEPPLPPPPETPQPAREVLAKLPAVPPTLPRVTRMATA